MSFVARVRKGMGFVGRRESQGTRMDAKRTRKTSFFGLPRAVARVMTRVRWSLRRRRTRQPADVAERMRKVRAELEEARRLDGSSPRART